MSWSSIGISIRWVLSAVPAPRARASLRTFALITQVPACSKVTVSLALSREQASEGVPATENVMLFPEALVARMTYVSPNLGFDGGVDVKEMSLPPGSVGLDVGSVGPVGSSVGPTGFTVGALESSTTGGVEDSVSVGVDGASESVVTDESFRPCWCESFWPWSPPVDGWTVELGAWVSPGGDPRSAASCAPPRCVAP
jgi:hypothetical protein